jgi:invasion protein IalB
MRHFHASKVCRNVASRGSSRERSPLQTLARFRQDHEADTGCPHHARRGIRKRKIFEEHCLQNGLQAHGLSRCSAHARPSPFSRRGGALLAAAALLLGGGLGHARAQEGTVKAQHGDWQIVCKDPPPGAKNEVCALVQSVTAEDRDNIGLTVYFQKFSNGTRVLRVFAPLGILLPPGLGLKIDDKDVGHAPFLRCHTFACYAQVVVEDPLIEQLKQGKTAIFIIFQTEEAGIGIPISLAGFKDALAELK